MTNLKQTIVQQRFGFWPSAVSAALVAKSNKRIRQVACIENTYKQQAALWIETRPELDGRCVIMIEDFAGKQRELLNQAGFSVRSLINSYGGGALLFKDDAVYFVNHNPQTAFNDQRIYRLKLDENLNSIGTPEAITAVENSCYGDLSYDEINQRLLCVREKQLSDNHSQQDIIAIENLAGNTIATPSVLVSGFDFFASPALSPSAEHLAYIAWNQPNMPWDNSELHVMEMRNRKDTRASLCANAALCQGESVQQARWHNDGQLYFISDRSNFWQLYRYDLSSNSCTAIISATTDRQHALHDAEFASPPWELGQCSYDFINNNTLVALSNKAGAWSIQSINLQNNVVTELEVPLELVNTQSKKILGQKDKVQSGRANFFAHLHASSTSLLCIAASPTSAATLIRVDLCSAVVEAISQTSDPLQLEPITISKPERIRFPAPYRDDSKESIYSHAFFYAPLSNNAQGEPNTLPPLIIKTHGGPTSSTTTQLDLSIQFFTSRGFAVVDINYQGSTGYGRNYRHALYSHWGVADLDDCKACIDYLAAENKIDGQRVFARGQSAGGYLTLMLACFTDRLCAGASTAGISDLSLLYRHTHKFEKEYLFNLLGCSPDNDHQAIYKQRSPLYADELKTPLLFIQGSEDKVVPAQQTQDILTRLKKEGVRAEYLLFPNEQHGLRHSKSIETALNAELAFFRSFL